MTIENLTPDVGTLEGTTYTIKDCNHNINVVFKLLFKGVKHKNIRKGCSSCTQAEVKQVGEDVEVTIIYAPFKGGAKGFFTKTFVEEHSEGETKITFKGTTK